MNIAAPVILNATRPWSVALAAAWLAGCSSNTGEEDWSAQIPLVWDEAAMATLEVPLPSPEHSPQHVDAQYYYAMTPRQVYRSYPVYHPDQEPEGYLDYLRTLEPEVVFDASTLVTKEDWIRAGELVFHEGDSYRPVDDAGHRENLELLRSGVLPVDENGKALLSRYFVRENGEVEVGTNSCALCHMRVLDDGTIIVGGPGTVPLGQLVASGRQNAPAAARRPFRSEEQTGHYRRYGAPWIDPDPGKLLEGKSFDEVTRIIAANVPGVQARERASALTGIRVPDLIGIEDRKYLDATGLVQHRSIGDLMRYAALNQGADEVSSFGGFIPLTTDGVNRPPPSHARLSRYTDAQLYALSLYIYSLTPPENPNPFNEAAQRGAAVFEDQECGNCHTPPLYTNNKLTPADGFDVPADHHERFDIENRRVGTDPRLTLGTRRGTGYYKVPSLKGVWYRGPFFHDGRLATLEDVFDPDRLEPNYVPTAYLEPWLDARPVLGHRFGLGLDERERADLIAFLRTL